MISIIGTMPTAIPKQSLIPFKIRFLKPKSFPPCLAIHVILKLERNDCFVIIVSCKRQPLK